MKLITFPEFRQAFNYDCGAKAMEAVLVFYGYDVNEKTVMDIAGTNRSGTMIKGLEKVAKKFGLKYAAGKMTIEEIKDYVDRKIPVIVPLQAWTESKHNDWEKDWKDGHYVVVIGYDKEKFYFEDPSSSCRVYLKYDEFMKRWHDVDVNGRKVINYGIAVYGKKSQYVPNKAVHMG